MHARPKGIYIVSILGYTAGLHFELEQYWCSATSCAQAILNAQEGPALVCCKSNPRNLMQTIDQLACQAPP